MMKLIKSTDKFFSETIYLLLVLSFTFTYTLMFICPERFIEKVVENNNPIIKLIMTIMLISMYILSISMFVDKYKAIKNRNKEM